jgi:hypothetical protein
MCWANSSKCACSLAALLRIQPQTKSRGRVNNNRLSSAQSGAKDSHGEPESAVVLVTIFWRSVESECRARMLPTTSTADKAAILVSALKPTRSM